MVRERPTLGAPFGPQGPWIAAVVDVLNDIHDLLDERLPRPVAHDGGGPVRISEPAPDRPGVRATPVAEPAPDGPEDEQAPDESPPPAPPRVGRGSNLEAWQAFARQTRVACQAGASRNDIIAACVRAQVIPAN